MVISKVSAIVVTWNGIKWIDNCLNSLSNSNYNVKVFVIDNGSTDGTIELIQKKYPSVEIVEMNQNLGFSKANNIGLKRVITDGYDYVLLLNQDSWLEKNTLKELIKTFNNNPDAGIVSPIHLNGSYSGLDNGFASYLSLNNTPNIISDMYFKRLKPYYKTEFVNAAAWLISRKCIEKVGVFDTTLFAHYGEDDNYCNRVRFHNFGIYISTETTICHDREGRSEKRPQIFEKTNQDLSKKIYYSNPFLADEIIEKQLYSLKSNYLRKILKYIILLKFKRLKEFKRSIRDEIKLFNTIIISREAYKNNGLKWLNELPPATEN